MASDLKTALAIALASTQIAATLDTFNGAPNIFSGTVPKAAGYSKYIVINRVSGVEDATLSGDTGLTNSRYQVDCVAPKEEDAITIKAAVLAAQASGGIQGYSGTPTASGVFIQSCFQAGMHDFDQPSPTDVNLQTFGRSIDFEIWHTLSPAASNRGPS